MSDPAQIPSRIIARLGLEPHPEGGWYRQTWRAEAATEGQDGRPTATAIYFLLEEHQRSHWHRVDGAELWFWHAGAPVALLTAPGDSGPVTRTVLGPQVLDGEAGQALVPTGHWQASEPIGGWALVSCVVSPGFHFGGFELAAPGWAPGQTPGAAAQP
ncbi:cupin domain-containing protein [Novosphingobium clariflavum]|uniref:Cupin domain-containing protein n=1 Tax=Novosphingobium clariflavum TaxID=2029884 RepID=A0ABV6SCV1_9SPHN|nr:cupin domain-containing protein [Novosphingobium clariflavum]